MLQKKVWPEMFYPRAIPRVARGNPPSLSGLGAENKEFVGPETAMKRLPSPAARQERQTEEGQ